MITGLTIATCIGNVRPIDPGIFIQKYVKQKGHATIQAYSDEDIKLSLVEMGSMTDEESLKFRQKQLKLKEIFDIELIPNNVQNQSFREAAVVHFGVRELNKFAKSLKNSIPEINGDLTCQDINDLSMEFMREGGSEGYLIWLKKSVIMVEVDDFSLHLMDVYKTHKKSHMRCGLLFCERPFRVVKATFTGNVRLR